MSIAMSFDMAPNTAFIMGVKGVGFEGTAEEPARIIERMRETYIYHVLGTNAP
ncbi:MAG: hypothetical protein VX944_12225 [Myxococcota bacterium]|nr:hypothetical protein [Myxococcota bacterium]